MGTCCCGTTPHEGFVGQWTDEKNVQLIINEAGNIQYNKMTEHSRVNFAGATRFSANEFFFCCCCCCLQGTYDNDDDGEPILVVNKTVLRRK
ncbi:unnamed protein product [Adineta ricciae]|nr:unnamed protein product [Adineta ricciae]